MEKYYAYNWFSWGCCNKFCEDPFGNKNQCGKVCTPHKWEDFNEDNNRCINCLAFVSKKESLS